MKIYCINLKRSTDRKTFQLEQARSLGLEIEFVDAVDFMSLAEDELIEAAQCWTRPIVGKDVGCFHSHRNAWRLVAEGTEPAIIMEDDVVFSDDLPSVIEALQAENFPDYRVYDLEFASRPHVLEKKAEWVRFGITATRIFVNKVGAGCYVITPKAAKRLLEEVGKYVMVDSWLWTRPWIEQVQIEPCPASQARDVRSHPSQSFGFELSTGIAQASTQPAIFHQKSWWRKKLIRLGLTFDQAGSYLKSVFRGERRMLKVQAESFRNTDIA